MNKTNHIEGHANSFDIYLAMPLDRVLTSQEAKFYSLIMDQIPKFSLSIKNPFQTTDFSGPTSTENLRRSKIVIADVSSQDHSLQEMIRQGYVHKKPILAFHDECSHPHDNILASIRHSSSIIEPIIKMRYTDPVEAAHLIEVKAQHYLLSENPGSVVR